MSGDNERMPTIASNESDDFYESASVAAAAAEYGDINEAMWAIEMQQVSGPTPYEADEYDPFQVSASSSSTVTSTTQLPFCTA